MVHVVSVISTLPFAPLKGADEHFHWKLMSSIRVGGSLGFDCIFLSRFFGIPLEVVGLNEQHGGGVVNENRLGGV